VTSFDSLSKYLYLVIVAFRFDAMLYSWVAKILIRAIPNGHVGRRFLAPALDPV